MAFPRKKYGSPDRIIYFINHGIGIAEERTFAIAIDRNSDKTAIDVADVQVFTVRPSKSEGIFYLRKRWIGRISCEASGWQDMQSKGEFLLNCRKGLSIRGNCQCLIGIGIFGDDMELAITFGDKADLSARGTFAIIDHKQAPAIRRPYRVVDLQILESNKRIGLAR